MHFRTSTINPPLHVTNILSHLKPRYFVHRAFGMTSFPSKTIRSTEESAQQMASAKSWSPCREESAGGLRGRLRIYGKFFPPSPSSLSSHVPHEIESSDVIVARQKEKPKFPSWSPSCFSPHRPQLFAFISTAKSNISYTDIYTHIIII